MAEIFVGRISLRLRFANLFFTVNHCLRFVSCMKAVVSFRILPREQSKTTINTKRVSTA